MGSRLRPSVNHPYRPFLSRFGKRRGGIAFTDSRHIYWSKNALVILDQRHLPRRKAYIRCRDVNSVAKAIRTMALRGAPLIGCAAAYGYALAARKLPATRSEWLKILSKAGKTLKDARPTAVNLMHAVDRMQAKAEEILKPSPHRGEGREAGKDFLFQSLKQEADKMFQEDLDANDRMADFGAALIPPNSSVITYCNTGALATCGIGTAFGVIHRAAGQGKVRHVYACETRPFLQGSRLTLWELMQARIPCTLITDNMAAHLMSREKIAAILVGADRIAANADAANKIGTYSLAILAKHHGIPFYVVAPTTTVDLKTPTGAAIPIEERSSEEVTSIKGIPIAPRGARARHPAFDVTPHELVTAIVTDRGVVQPANETNLKKIAAQQ